MPIAVPVPRASFASRPGGPAGPRPSRLARLVAGRASWIRPGPLVEGRAAVRVPFREPVVVTPWDVGADAPAGPSAVAGGRDLSPGGLTFAHAGPLACRFAAVSFRGDGLDADGFDADGSPAVETVLARLLWCRFTGRGYLAGGRFAGVLAPDFGRPLAALFADAAADMP